MSWSWLHHCFLQDCDSWFNKGVNLFTADICLTYRLWAICSGVLVPIHLSEPNHGRSQLLTLGFLKELLNLPLILTKKVQYFFPKAWEPTRAFYDDFCNEDGFLYAFKQCHWLFYPFVIGYIINVLLFNCEYPFSSFCCGYS